MACNLDSWERYPLHPPGFWTVLESVIGPLVGLVSEEQLIPVPDEIWDLEPTTQPNGPAGAPAGSHTPQLAEGTGWEGVTMEQWQAYALQQGWDLGYLQQQAYYQQYGAWSTDTSAMAHTQVPYGQQLAGQQWPTTFMGTTPESYSQDPSAIVSFGNYCSATQEFPGFHQPAASAQQHGAQEFPGFCQPAGTAQQHGAAAASWPTQSTLHQAHLYSAQHPYPATAEEPQQQIAAQQPKPVSQPDPKTLMERAGSTYALQLAFPRLEDVRPVVVEASTQQDNTHSAIVQAKEAVFEQAGGRRLPGQNSVAQTSRFERPVSSESLVTTAMAWHTPNDAADAYAAASMSPFTTATGQAYLADSASAAYAAGELMTGCMAV